MSVERTQSNQWPIIRVSLVIVQMHFTSDGKIEFSSESIPASSDVFWNRFLIVGPESISEISSRIEIGSGIIVSSGIGIVSGMGIGSEIGVSFDIFIRMLRSNVGMYWSKDLQKIQIYL